MDGRVANQHIDAAEPFYGKRAQPRHLPAIREVERVRDGVAVSAPEGLWCLLSRGRFTVGQDRPEPPR